MTIHLIRLAPILVIMKMSKGFINNINGTSEYIGVLNKLITDAQRNNKEIYFLTLDFKNAIGSQPLYKSTFYPISCARNSFTPTGTYVHLWTHFYREGSGYIKGTFFLMNYFHILIACIKQLGRSVHIEREIRQGCPLSSIIFNMCIEPMLRNILINSKDDGNFVNDIFFNIQAFVDDVVIISYSINCLRRMIYSVDNFGNACGMKLIAS